MDMGSSPFRPSTDYRAVLARRSSGKLEFIWFDTDNQKKNINDISLLIFPFYLLFWRTQLFYLLFSFNSHSLCKVVISNNTNTNLCLQSRQIP